jgi:hypothetical protein
MIMQDVLQRFRQSTFAAAGCPVKPNNIEVHCCDLPVLVSIGASNHQPISPSGVPRRKRQCPGRAEFFALATMGFDAPFLKKIICKNSH